MTLPTQAVLALGTAFVPRVAGLLLWQRRRLLPLSGPRTAVLAMLVLALLDWRVSVARAQVQFMPQVTYAVGDEPVGVAIADFSMDGLLDIAVTNRGAGKVSILYGLAGGGFAAHQDFAVIGLPTSGITAADFSGDGRPDITVTGGITASIYYGLPTGGFGSTRTMGVGTNPIHPVAADLNQDGRQDLVVANFDQTTVSVLLQQADRSFSRRDYSVGGPYPDSIAVADFTRDGILDLAVARVHDTLPGGVALLAGGPGATFGAPQQFAAGNHPRGITTADLNGDGWPDIATANHGSCDVTVLYGVTGGGFSAPEAYPLGPPAHDIVAGDFNRDGFQDLAATGLGTMSVYLLYGKSTGGFTLDPTSYAVGGWCWYMDAADLDNNGGLDLVVSNGMDDTVSVLYNTVPEPATLALLALGGLGILLRRKRT